MPSTTPDPTRHSPVPIERLPDAFNYRLLIIQSPDPLMWYAKKVGQTVPYVGHWPEGFKSREEGRADEFTQGQSCGADDCEAAILALKETP